MGTEHYRELGIDLIKFIACILVVILHSINPSQEFFHEAVYLLGSFGIPLYFMVNGYLRANKNFTFRFAWQITIRYVRFIIMWVIIVGTAKWVVLRKVDFVILAWGGVIGKNTLFHLWFLMGLCAIYFVIAFGNFMVLRHNITINEILIQKPAGLVVIILMTVVFVSDFFLLHVWGTEIREIIYPSLRIITNGGYFVLGMMISGQKDNINLSRQTLSYIVICFIVVIITSKITGILWASSFYDFITVIIGTALLFLLIKRKFEHRISERFYKIINTSTGVWILHPFVLKVLNKIYTILFGSLTLLSRCGILAVTVVVCVMMTMFINRIKCLKWLITP